MASRLGETEADFRLPDDCPFECCPEGSCNPWEGDKPCGDCRECGGREPLAVKP